MKRNKRIFDIFEISHDAIIIMDSENHIIFSNSLGKTMINLFCSSEFEKNENSMFLSDISPMKRAIKGESFKNSEIIISYEKEENRTLSISGGPYKENEKGLPAGIVFISVPERGEKEDFELETYLYNQQMLNEELSDKIEEISKKNDELVDFSHIVAHDLKTPLNSMRGFLEIIKEDKRFFNKDLKKYFDYVLKSAESMGELIDEILHYAVEKEEAKKVKIDINDVLSEVAIDLKGLIDLCGGHLVYEEMGKLRCVRIRLKQLLENIIGNSFKYRRKEVSPLVRVSMSKRTIIIEDNGIGFPQEKVDEIFKPMRRLDTGDEIFEGTGIGLATCKKIIEEHGWTIRVESHPGLGTRFFIKTGS